jgi:hypothetical protein
MADEYVVVQDAETASCGSMVFWTMSGDTLREALNLALEGAGLSRVTLPRTPPKLALQRALADVYAGNGHKVVALDRTRATVQREVKDPASKRVRYSQILVAQVNGDDTVGLAYDAVNAADPESWRVAEIQTAYEHHRAHVTGADIGAWLAKVMSSLDAQWLRSGVFFLPKQAVPILLSIQGILEIHGHAVWRGPMMKSEDVTRMVLDALAEEARKAMDEIRSGLNSDTEISERGRRGKLDALDAVKAKVTKFEKIFAHPMSAMLGELQKLRNDIAGVAFIGRAADAGQDVTEGARVLELDDREPAAADEDDTNDRIARIVNDDAIDSMAASS